MSTARIFDSLAREYDAWYERHAAIAESEARLVRAMMAGAPRPSLEVGVGTGFFASAAGIDVGLDPSLGMLEAARGRGLEDLVAGVGERAPLRSSSFGSALIAVTLCFVDDPLAVLGETARVLRAGGLVVVCVVPRDSPWGRFYAELGARGHRFYSRARFYTVGELVEMLEASGLAVEGAWATLSAPPPGPPEAEDPSPSIEGRGFVCVRARKRA